jgi:hypothetical protein
MLNYIYLLLKQQILTVPGIAEADWFNNQYDLEEDDEVIYALPGAYIEFMSTPMKSLPKGVQMGQLRFRIHLVTELYRDNDRRFETGALDHYNLVALVYNSLLDYSASLSDLPEYVTLKDTDNDFKLFNSVTRLNIAPGPKNRKFLVTIQEFETQAWDWTGNNKYKKITSIL